MNCNQRFIGMGVSCAYVLCLALLSAVFVVAQELQNAADEVLLVDSGPPKADPPSVSSASAFIPAK